MAACGPARPGGAAAPADTHRFERETVFVFGSHKVSVFSRVPGNQDDNATAWCEGSGDKTGLDIWAPATVLMYVAVYTLW